MSSQISAAVVLHLWDSREMVSVCTYVLRESGKLWACGFWGSRGWGRRREVNVTNYLCDVLKQNPLGFLAGCSNSVFQHVSELILFDFALSSGFSEVACLRTFAFNSLKFLSEGRQGNRVMALAVCGEGVMADFLYIFSSFRSFYKTSSHQWSPPDIAHPWTGVPLFFSFKARAM